VQVDFEATEGPRALRLTLRYQGQQVELIDREELAMVVPPHEELPTEGEVSGFWYELQDTAEATVYRRLGRNPMLTHVEIPTGDPREPLAYTEVDRPSGIFRFVVPVSRRPVRCCYSAVALRRPSTVCRRNSCARNQSCEQARPENWDASRSDSQGEDI
jgi:hypothetical protein